VNIIFFKVTYGLLFTLERSNLVVNKSEWLISRSHVRARERDFYHLFLLTTKNFL